MLARCFLGEFVETRLQRSIELVALIAESGGQVILIVIDGNSLALLDNVVDRAEELWGEIAERTQEIIVNNLDE